MILSGLERQCLDEFKSVIIWGWPLGSHTHSYIHEAWFRVFSEFYKKDTHWFHDGNYPKEFDYENCIFITEGYADGAIPIVPSSVYFVHDCIRPERYVSKGARLIETRYNLNELHDMNNTYKLDDGTHDLVKISEHSLYEKLSSNSGVSPDHRGPDPTPMEYEALYIYWATDLLPTEINLDDAYNERKNIIDYIASPRTSTKQDEFRAICEKNNITWKPINPWETPVETNMMHELLKTSALCPDFRPLPDPKDIEKYGEMFGANHIVNGLIPCRPFKAISCGHIGITDSRAVKKLLGEHVLYDEDMNVLFEMAMKERTNYDRIKAAMAHVRDNHTYAQRARDLLRSIVKKKHML